VKINYPNRPFQGGLTSKVYNIRQTVPHIDDSARKKIGSNTTTSEFD